MSLANWNQMASNREHGQKLPKKQVDVRVLLVTNFDVLGYL